MNDDQFTKLFKYMQDGFETVNAKLDSKADKQDVQNLMDAIDSFAKQAADS